MREHTPDGSFCVEEQFDVPIIGLTAEATGEDRDKALEAGCSDLVQKPLDTDQLLAVIKKWIFQL